MRPRERPPANFRTLANHGSQKNAADAIIAHGRDNPLSTAMYSAQLEKIDNLASAGWSPLDGERRDSTDRAARHDVPGVKRRFTRGTGIRSGEPV